MATIPHSEAVQVTQRELKRMLDSLTENGTANVRLLRIIWGKFGFKKEHHNLMVKLLVCFNFAYVKCQDERVNEIVNGLVKDQFNDGCGDLLSLLEENNGELLLPWFLCDEKPEGLPAILPSDQFVSVRLTYSFAMSLPEGLFQRLSARCHRHCSYIRHCLNGVSLRYGPVTVTLQCDVKRSEIVLSAVTSNSYNAPQRLWHVVWRLVRDLEDLIDDIPGTKFAVQRYLSADHEGVQSEAEVGALPVKVKLLETNAPFLINQEDVIAPEVEMHKKAVANAHAVLKTPLRSIFSTHNGQKLGERQTSKVARCITVNNVVSDLMMILGVKESAMDADFAKSKQPSSRALAVINKWRECSGHSCISVVRDALHELGLQEVDKAAFGHIHDLTLNRPEEARRASLISGS